jgi:hypothetical protein
MSVFNSVPPITFGPNGPVLPTEAAILTGVQADINTAFGGGVNPDLRTPQGQIASTWTAGIGDKNNQFAYLVNMFDPQYSVGRYQGALGHIYFMDRIPAQSTVVNCTVTGGTGVVIPVGAQAQASDNTIYVCTAAVTIPAGGSISTTFAAVPTGPIACPANSLNKIYLAIPGWDSINNPTDGAIGRNVESARDFELRRQQTVAINGVNSIQAIAAKVASTAGVVDQYCTQNDTGSPVTVGGVTLAAHSLYVCVSGGAAADIAQSIWSKKPPGTSYNGSTSYTIYDTTYTTPQPSYTVSWTTATNVAIKIAVQVVNSSTLPPNYVTLIKNALIAAFAGADGGPVARIGSLLTAGRYYAPVVNAATPGSTITPVSVLTGTSTPTLTSVQMQINQRPTLTASDITVTAV